MSNLVISIQNLTKVYKLYERPMDRLKESLNPFKKSYHKDFYALRDVTFEVNKGETIGIIGKNGSGKSTLLKIITGVLNPSAGDVIINGKISALLELGAGFNPELTGYENIYLNGTIMGYSKEEMDKKVDDILLFADIGDFVHQPVKSYSSGMFVRLAFAVAVSVEPEILIVDEALAVGDIAFQAKCMAKMNQIMKNGTTILFVTHDMNTIKNLCNRCIYLEKGYIKTIGQSEEIADMYLKEIRENMNAENKKVIDILSKTGNNSDKFINFKNKTNMFKYDKEFDNRVEPFRQGTGDVKVRAVELVDEFDNEVFTAKFNQQIKLKIYIEFLKDMEIGVGYHIRDDKNVELLGSYTRLEHDKKIKGSKGDKLLIEFVTNLPLLEGAYNITIVVSTPVILNRTSLFVDYIENARLFEVLERDIAKLWDKVYVKNICNVSIINN